MDPRHGRTLRCRSVSFVLAAMVAAGIASGCGGPATVVPATATLSPATADGGNGWYRSGPVMTLAGAEESGAAYGLQYSLDGGQSWLGYSDPVTLPEGVTTISYRTTDIWGMPTAVAQFGYASDRTGPVVAYTGGGFYWLGDFILIGCSVGDSLSGVASNHCRPIQGYGYDFGYGTHTRSATASDFAGNTGTGTVSFRVMDPIIFTPILTEIPVALQ